VGAGAGPGPPAGQAMHWFDLDRALPEIARVLRPGGGLAGLWNVDDDRVGWVAELAERAGLLARVRDFLRTRPETSRGEFTLPMVTVALRVRRR
jgi:SAM-dependent methyltransferase